MDQIEYRHQQTRDLSPVASSMSSASLGGWNIQIRDWVRHPHADRLTESVCYQVLTSSRAALAWRYWDQKAAQRADGSRGRPLVSRVLAGQPSVLTPDVAVALCLTGPTADIVGLLPGEVADGSGLPRVNGAALIGMVSELAPELDAAAARHPGPELQAVVAAALSAERATPLAISFRENIIQRPLRDGVQYPLLWGLWRIVRPVLGPVGRDWSFSTFELPLGDTDPASLPSIVFRQMQDGASIPPTRTRKEVRVRPSASDALGVEMPYSGYVELAGWLVAEFHNQGGDRLAELIAKWCGSERIVEARIDRILAKLQKTRPPAVLANEELSQATVAIGLPLVESQPRDSGQAAINATGAEAMRAAGREVHHPALVAQSPAPEVMGDGNPALETTPPRQEEPGRTEPRQAEPPEPGSEHASVVGAGPDSWRPDSGIDDVVPVHPEIIISDPGHAAFPDYEQPGGSGSRPAPWRERERQLRPQREGRDAPPLPSQGRSVPSVTGWGAQSPGVQNEVYEPSATVNSLLKKLELVTHDPEQFESVLRRIFLAGEGRPEDNDLAASWDVISNNDWYAKVCTGRALSVDEWAKISAIVVIPQLRAKDAAERVAENVAWWAYEAPRPMIGGLLAAARKDHPDMWKKVMRILVPILATRWAAESLSADGSIPEFWDRKFAAEVVRADRKGSFKFSRRS